MSALLEEMAPAQFRVLQGQARDADSDVALVEALRRREPQAELAAWNRFATGVDQTLRGLLTGICIHVVRGEIARRQRRRWLSLTATGDLPEPLPSAPDLEGREAV